MWLRDWTKFNYALSFRNSYGSSAWKCEILYLNRIILLKYWKIKIRRFSESWNVCCRNEWNWWIIEWNQLVCGDKIRGKPLVYVWCYNAYGYYKFFSFEIKENI